jgi:hypothetical protein
MAQLFTGRHSAVPAHLRGAIREFEGVVTAAAIAATQASEGLERLVRQANEVLPDTGEQRRALGLELFKAGGTPAGGRFEAPRWPRLGRSQALAAAEAAALIRAAAAGHVRLDDAARSQAEAEIKAWQAQLAQVQAAAAEFAEIRAQNLAGAVRSVFQAAIPQWQARLATASRLLDRLETLPETDEQRHLLQSDVRDARERVNTIHLDSAGLTAQMHTTQGMDEVALWLARVPYEYRTAEDVLKDMIGVLVDEPMRQAAAAIGLGEEMRPLLGQKDGPLQAPLRGQLAVMQPFHPAPGPVAEQPLEEMDGALSRSLAWLRSINGVIRGFAANAARALPAAWEPRVTAVRGLAEQALELQHAPQLADPADPELQAASDSLTTALRGLPERWPGLSAEPGPAELDAVRQALGRAAAVERAVGNVVSRVSLLLDEHVTVALRMAVAAAAATGPRQHAIDPHQLAALHEAEQAVRNSVRTQLPPQQGVPPLAAVRDARQRLADISELRKAAEAVLGAATAGVNDLRQQVEAAERLASDARP